MVCGLISWFVLCRIYRRAGGVGENMRRSRNHLLRNVMLFLQTLICMTFVCCTFILVNGSHRIFEACNIPDNNDLYKEYLYYDPEFCVDKKRVLSEIISLPELDKAILCGGAYMPPKEIRDNPEIKEIAEKDGYIWSHTLEDQIQGQIEAGFAIIGFYEDIGGSVLDKYINSSIATKAIKL